MNRWETLFLLIMTLPIMGHVVILLLLLDVAGRDSWISVILSLPIAFLFAWWIYRLRTKYAGYNFPDIIKAIVGKGMGWAILLLFTLYFLCLSAFSIAALADLTRVAFLPETPVLAISSWAMLFCFYAAKQGVKKISHIACVLGVIAMFTGHSITLLSTPKKDFFNITPILEYGWIPVLIGTLILSSIWVELAFLLLVPIKWASGSKMFLFWSIGILLNAIMMISTSTGAIMVFGAEQADNMVYPALEVVRLIRLGFVDRFDVYAMILMSFGCYIRGSLYLRVAFDLVYPVVKKETQQKNWLLFGTTVLVGYLAYYLSAVHLRFEQFTIYYSYSIVLLPLPLLLLVASWFRKRGAVTGT